MPAFRPRLLLGPGGLMSDTELLRDAIAAIDRKMTEGFKRQDRRSDGQDDTLRRIEVQVRETNGRVTTIEKERAAEQAVSTDNTERRVRREDYRRGPLVQHMIAGAVGGIALAGLLIAIFH